MAGHYRVKQRLAAARDLQPVISDGNDGTFADSDHFVSLATR
jgi:hypothetical protein